MSTRQTPTEKGKGVRRGAKSLFERLRTGGSSAYRLYALVAFYARERKPLFDDATRQAFATILPEVCNAYEYELIAFRLTPEQAHMVLAFKPVDTIADMISNIKRSTAHRLFETIPDLEQKIGRRNFWAEGYFAETLSYSQVEPLIRHWEERYKNEKGSLVQVMYDWQEPIPGSYITRAMEILLPAERAVLRMLYGLEGETAKSPEQIAELLSLKPDEVRQIAKESLERVRVHLYRQRIVEAGGKAHE